MKYFVLNPNKNDKYGKASRAALRAYAEEMDNINPELATDLYNWLDEICCDIDIEYL